MVRGRVKPKFKKGTSAKDRVEALLQEQGRDLGDFQVRRFGWGNVYYIIVEDRIIGEYIITNHKLHLYRNDE